MNDHIVGAIIDRPRETNGLPYRPSADGGSGERKEKRKNGGTPPFALHDLFASCEDLLYADVLVECDDVGVHARRERTLMGQTHDGGRRFGQHFHCIEKRMEIEKELKEYPEFYELYIKHLNVLSKLLCKEIEMDITEVDKDAFIAGVVKGKKDAPVHEIVGFFAPIFKEEENVATDLSELDEYFK